MAEIPNAQRYRQQNRSHRTAGTADCAGSSRNAEQRDPAGQGSASEEPGPLGWILAAGLALLALFAAR